MYRLLAEPLVALSVLMLLSVIIHYMWIQLRVGRLRMIRGIAAPATTGDPEFERAFRVQANSVEQLAVFLPCYMILIVVTALQRGEQFLWVTVVLGFIYLIGRVLYARAYMQDAAKRGLGAIITFVVQALMMLALIIQFLLMLY